MKFIYSWLGASFLCVLTLGSAWLFFSSSAAAKRAAAPYDLAVNLTSAHDRATSGGRVYFLVSVTNRSGDTANEVLLKFTLPAGLTHLICLPEFGTCGGAGNQRTVTIATLSAGQTRAATFVAMVNNPTSNGTMLTAEVTVEPTAMDTDRNNNSARASVTVAELLLRAKRNGKILYSLYDGFTTGVSGLFTINQDGSGQQRLPDLGRAPVWSPDGTRLAYFVRDSGTRPEDGEEIFVSAPDGTNKRRVATQAANIENSRLSWSPDGAKLVFTSINSRLLAITHADGSGQLLLPNSPIGTNDPDWSPDGGRLAFTKDGLIWTMNLDGTELRRITTRSNFNEFHARPRWSPDGTQLLCSRNNGEAVLVNADGSGQTRAFNTNGQRDATWSPDGAKVVFVTYGPLFSINYDGSEFTQLTTPPTIQAQAFAPEWQPLPTSGTPQPLPTPPTFSIRGRTVNEEGRPFGVTIRLSGTLTGIAGGEEPPPAPSPEQDGRFALVRLLRGGTYTLTPEHPAYRFDPPSRTYTNLSANLTGADFRAIFRPLAIRGRITDSAGLPIAGVPFRFNSPFWQIETDEDGRYAFTNLFGGAMYSLTPLGYAANDLYEPSNAEVALLTESKEINFKGRREQFEVSGFAKDGTDQPMSGVMISLTSTQAGNNVSRTATTDAAGQFNFTGVMGGFVYSLKANKSGISFAPAERRLIVNAPTSVTFYSGATPAAAVSAASYRATDITLGSIISVFGTGLATTTKAAGNQPLPTELEGVTATVVGRNLNRPCQLFFVSPQ